MTNHVTESDKGNPQDALILQWGKEMMQACPQETAGLTLSQCIEAWLEYSERMYAGWMSGYTDTETVGQVMRDYWHKE